MYSRRTFYLKYVILNTLYKLDDDDGNNNNLLNHQYMFLRTCMLKPGAVQYPPSPPRITHTPYAPFYEHYYYG
jgi:hypothetical protein